MKCIQNNSNLSFNGFAATGMIGLALLIALLSGCGTAEKKSNFEYYGFPFGNEDQESTKELQQRWHQALIHNQQQIEYNEEHGLPLYYNTHYPELGGFLWSHSDTSTSTYQKED